MGRATLAKGAKQMTRYTIKQPCDLEDKDQTPQYIWWRIFDPGKICIMLVSDEKHADIVCSMLNYRQDARAKLDLGGAP